VDFKIRNLYNDNCGSTGVMLILVPFIVVMLLSVVYLPMGGGEEIPFDLVVTPDGYDEMSEGERAEYLAELHGQCVKNWHWRFELSWPDFAGNWYMDFEDGFSMKFDKYNDFLSGDYVIDMGDVSSIITGILTLNPVCLGDIGIYGIFVRLILIFSVIVGIVELLWIG